MQLMKEFKTSPDAENTISSELDKMSDNNELAIQLNMLISEINEKISGNGYGESDSGEVAAPVPDSIISTMKARNNCMKEHLEEAISTARQINDSI